MSSFIFLTVCELPAVLLVYNFVWHYRLEMTADTLTMHKLFWMEGRSVHLEEIRRVIAQNWPLGNNWLVFEWDSDRIRFTPRSYGANLWPPVILARMLRRLEKRGIEVTPEAWARLGRTSEKGAPGLLRWIVPVALGGGVTAIVGRELFAAMAQDFHSGFIAGAALLLSGGTLATLLYLNDNYYGELSDVSPDSWSDDRAA